MRKKSGSSAPTAPCPTRIADCTEPGRSIRITRVPVTGRSALAGGGPRRAVPRQAPNASVASRRASSAPTSPTRSSVVVAGA